MEFTQLIAPGGEWGKVWLAAHWEKRLKRQDYADIDLCKLLASFVARRRLLTLRATGHLLVGGVKVFARKCQMLEEEAQEVRERLWLAFSGQGRQRPNGGDAAAGDHLGRLLREVDAESRVDQEALLGGKRHVARLEDITLRAPMADLAAGLAAAGPLGEDLFGPVTGEELEAALRELLGAARPQQAAAEAGAGPETQPLEGAEARPAGGGEGETPALDLETPMPLEMDLPAVEEELDPWLAGAADEPEEPSAEPAPARERADAKRRRCVYDEVTEIPRATYQGYVNDRSAITRPEVMDFGVLLPHCSPELPRFTTTHTDLCPALNDLLVWGTEVAERLRRQLRDEEQAGPPARGEAPPPAAPRPAAPLGEAAAAARRPAGAPRTLSGVVSAGDAEAGLEARVGYSGRTEKMHRYLAREFAQTGAEALSFESLCRTRRRDLVAGGFFELLVLKTNGVVGLRQERPKLPTSGRTGWTTQARPQARSCPGFRPSPAKSRAEPSASTLPVKKFRQGLQAQPRLQQADGIEPPARQDEDDDDDWPSTACQK